MNFGVASFIGNSMGMFCDMEMDESGRTWGDSLRIRVAINITQPLIRALRVRTTMGGEVVVSFTYERLQNFCYLCGCLGHLSAVCELRFEEGFQDPGEAMPYDAWLRAPPRTWGSHKPWKAPESAPIKRGLSSSSARSPAVFGRFEGRHESKVSSAQKGKGAVQDEPADTHKNLKVGLEEVQSECSDSLASHIPKTGVLAAGEVHMGMVESAPLNVAAGDDGFSSHPLLVWTPIEIPMEMDERLVPVPISFAAGMRSLMAKKGRGRRRIMRRGSLIVRGGARFWFLSTV
ncbi:UNVERIFIED_CONTAM: hypothetical protein Slati_0432500 [Sesamum latifolium]|uniref:Zinc knuckle CX2CX4HX4C domain-containing protein n=1 Tax=Sesamum latifolium TaxID=2727402 RepID=A0AAW2XVB6_9LAMI